MISEEFKVVNKTTGKYIFGTFNKEEALNCAKLNYDSRPKNEYEVIRIVTMIDCIYNSKHSEYESKFVF